MSSPRKWSVSFVSVALSLTLLASACSGSKNDASRSASAAAGNPVELPALASTSATGERVPMWFDSVLTPDSWVSTSLSPVLAVPGAPGAWTFKLSDLSDGTSPFGTRTYVEVGASTRIPVDTLKNGNTYVWTAESPGRDSVGGSFTVDVQMLDAQQVDSLGGIESLLSSGEAAYTWNSHTVQAIGSAVGVSLRFQASNAPSPGMPAGWKLNSASGSQYLSVVSREDGSVGLVAKNGQVSSYRRGAGGAWNPVRMAGDGLNTSGLAPVLIRNSDGSWSVTTKSSTAKFVDDNGDGTANLSDISADGAPVVTQEWSGGLLRKVTDPVSGRSVQLVYGGDSCPKPVSGFVSAPTGLLCQVKFWDGSTSEFSYVKLADGSVSIGRLTDFPEAGAEGAQVADIAYDASGRIGRTRSPLVAVAAASSIVSPDDTEFMVDVTYRPDGRVAKIADAAASKGSVRCVRSFRNEGTSTSVTDSCLDKVVMSMTFDGSTFFPLTMTDITGRVATYRWNLTTGELLSAVDSSGRITENTFDHGKLVRTIGPSRDLGIAPVALHEYDETYADSPDGVPMRGLDVVYWPSVDNRGADAVKELGPLKDGQLVGSLTLNWDSSPAGNRDGNWSGLMTGTVEISTPGTYSFASGNSTARLRIANLACVDGGCSAVQLPAGPVSIRIEIESETPEASIDLTWSGPDTGGAMRSIPTEKLRPQFNLGTELTGVDPTAVRSNSDNISRSSFANPSNGMLTARTNGAGTVSGISYEGAGWNRPTESVLPAGNRVIQTWWGDRESATAPCPGAKAAVQGGAAKQSITPSSDGGAGPSAQQWYTASGALAGTQIAGGMTSCITYDRAGRVLRTESLGLGTATRSEIVYAVNGNPLVTMTTETQGGEITTSTMEVDLAGRLVRSVDRNGITTLLTYDARTGAVATTTSTPPGGAPVVTINAYDEFARPTTTTIDGRLVSTIRYDSYGFPVSVGYGNGAVTNFSYDAQNSVVGAVVTVGGHSYSSTRVVSSAGATSSSQLMVDGRSSTFEYTHDSNGRLSQISLSPGLAPEARSWVYGYDANSNRTSQSVTVGERTNDYTYSYDAADRLVSTTDPSASSGITYDERGNVLNLGADTFTYDAANLLISATDGASSVGFLRSATGSVVGKTTTDDRGTTTVRYGAGGFVLNDSGEAIAQISALPGGVQYTRTLGAATGNEWTFTTVRGDRFFTLDDTGSQLGDISMYTPFGEPVMGASPLKGSRPDLSWKATEGNETLALRTPIVAMGQRVYVPSLGRFIQVDPVVGGSANGYDYANQDPTANSDPAGTDNTILTDYVAPLLLGVGAVGLAITLRSPGSLLTMWGVVGGATIGFIVAGAVNRSTTGSTMGDPTTMLIGVLAGAVIGGVALKLLHVRSLRVRPQDPVNVRSQADQMVDALERNNRVRVRKPVPPRANVQAPEAVPQPANGAAPQAPAPAPVAVEAPRLSSPVRASVSSSSSSSSGGAGRNIASGDYQGFNMEDMFKLLNVAE